MADAVVGVRARGFQLCQLSRCGWRGWICSQLGVSRTARTVSIPVRKLASSLQGS